KGDTIVWINKDMVEHDVTEEATNAWTSSRIPAGGSWEMVATQSDAYFCSLHVVMKGKVIVDGNELAMAEGSPFITKCGGGWLIVRPRPGLALGVIPARALCQHPL